MNTEQELNISYGIFFDPIFLGELKYCKLQGIPWTTSKYGKLLFGEERKLVRKAISKLLKSDHETYPLC